MRREQPGWVLEVDGVPQSAVNPSDPAELTFAYIRHMGAVIDLAFPESTPLTALHLGAGALTLPRYIEHTRPGSRQQVIELEPAIVELVRDIVPLPRSASIRIRYGDARAGLTRLPQGLLGSADLAIADVFAGPSTPAHVTSTEFFAEVGAFLAPDGIVLANIADGRELSFARGCIAGMRAALGHAAMIADPGVLKGRRFGNITVIASRKPIELPGLHRLAASGFPPARYADEAETTAWLGTARPARDAEATGSPVPGGNVFRLHRDEEW